MKKYSTFESIATTFNPSVNARLLNKLESAYLSNTPTMRFVAEVFGEDQLALWLRAQINSIDRYNGTTVDADFESVGEMAQHFVRQYGSIKLTEFMLFVARFKLGFYGKFYGAFDPITLGSAFRLFLRERHKEITELEARKKARAKTDFVPPQGYTSYTWYQEVKRRAAQGDEEAIELLKPPAMRKKNQ